MDMQDEFSAAEEEWEDFEGDFPVDAEPTASLFDPTRTFPNPHAALAYDAETHHFDLPAFVRTHALGEYDILRLVTYIRRSIQADPTEPGALIASLGQPDVKRTWTTDDDYLVPIDPTDPLLFLDVGSMEMRADGGHDDDYDDDDDKDDDDEEAKEEGERNGRGVGTRPARGRTDPRATHENRHHKLRRDLASLEAENEALRETLAIMVRQSAAALGLDERGEEESMGRENNKSKGKHEEKRTESSRSVGPASKDADPTTTTGSQSQAQPHPQALRHRRADVEKAYYGSYAGFGIHREMLSDQPRTEAYRIALEENPALVRGARVLDVGCGTGVLSMFAARGGARAVVAVDGSERIAGFARANVRANGMEYPGGVHLSPPEVVTTGGGGGEGGEGGGGGGGGREPGAPGMGKGSGGRGRATLDTRHDSTNTNHPTGINEGDESRHKVITVISSTVENLNLRSTLRPDVDQVDILVSEWMGYALLFETMLPSVLEARDKWLRPGGAMLPDRARMFLALGAAGAAGLTFWDNVYGLTMHPIRSALFHDATSTGEALVREVAAKDILSPPATILDLDLTVCQRQDLTFSAPFTLRLSPSDADAQHQPHHEAHDVGIPSSTYTLVYTLVLWFDTSFSGRFCAETPVVLDTSPHVPPTHWVQTVLTLKTPLRVRAHQDVVVGTLSIADSVDKHRGLDLAVEVWVEEEEEKEREEREGAAAPGPRTTGGRRKSQYVVQSYQMTVI